MKNIKQIYPSINNIELSYLKRVIKSKYLTENKLTAQFEEEVKKLTNAKFAIAVNNWTLGLFCCAQSLGIGPGDEVIVPNNTFIATANSILLTGAKVVLCDVDSETFNIKPENIKKILNARTKAVVPVHLYGNMCEMEEIIKLKKIQNFKIIEDAAQAIGVYYKKKHAGTIGDAGGFSFYGNKIITTGEGGMIITNNRKIYEKIHEFKNYGRKSKGLYFHEKIGYNFKFTEMQAALGLAQLTKLNKFIKKKQKIFDFYYNNLNKIKKISFLKQTAKSKIVHWFTNIKIKNSKKLQKFLSLKNIETRSGFYPLHLQPCYKGFKKIITKYVDNEEAIKNYNNFLCLPSSVEIKNLELKKVVKNIKLFLSEKN
jgi:perosamine synthetase